MNFKKFSLAIGLLFVYETAIAKFLGIDNLLSDNEIKIHVTNVYNNNVSPKYYKADEEVAEDYADTVIFNKSDVDLMDDEDLRESAWRYSKAGQQYDAIRLYKKSIALNSQNWKSWHGYGGSLLKLKKYKEAGKAFGKAINLGNNSESWRFLGWNYELRKEYDKAIFCYKKSLQINPKNFSSAHAYFEISKSLYKDYSKDSLYVVKARPHLRYRAYPDEDAKSLGDIKNRETINVIKNASETISISGRKGKWVLFKHRKKFGYIFSGYLVKKSTKKAQAKVVKNKQSSKFTVQLQAFNVKSNALKYQSTRAEKHIFIFFDKKVKKFIVGVGSFNNFEAAKRHQSFLESKGTNGFVKAVSR